MAENKMEIATALSHFFRTLPMWLQIGWVLSFILFLGMSGLSLITWSVAHHRREKSELIRIVHPELKTLRKFLAKTVEAPNGNYFDPAAYRHYFEAANYFLSQAKLNDPVLFKNFEEVPVPEASKTTDFEGHGYFTRAQFKPLIENVDRMLALIEEKGVK